MNYKELVNYRFYDRKGIRLLGYKEEIIKSLIDVEKSMNMSKSKNMRLYREGLVELKSKYSNLNKGEIGALYVTHMFNFAGTRDKSKLRDIVKTLDNTKGSKLYDLISSGKLDFEVIKKRATDNEEFYSASSDGEDMDIDGPAVPARDPPPNLQPQPPPQPPARGIFANMAEKFLGLGRNAMPQIFRADANPQNSQNELNIQRDQPQVEAPRPQVQINERGRLNLNRVSNIGELYNQAVNARPEQQYVQSRVEEQKQEQNVRNFNRLFA
jgi:hypothetical protein